MRASTELDNLMDAGFGFRNAEDGQNGHTHLDVTNGFDYFDVIFKVGNEYYQGVINIKNISKGKLLKDITKIKNITEDMTSRYGENPSYAFLRDVSIDSISQSAKKSSGLVKNVGSVDDAKYSLSGVNSATADSTALQNAEMMLEDGVDSEAIRQETGWFKGYDGKWRYEIDDSKMQVSDSLLSKYSKGQIWLCDYVDREPLTLEQVISHEELFKAYPQLREMKVYVKQSLGKGIVAAYNHNIDGFYVSNSIQMTESMFKEMMVHEIQHKIQRIEGFARGSSPDYWKARGIGKEEYKTFVANLEQERVKILSSLTEQERKDYLRYRATSRRADELLNKIDFNDLCNEAVTDELFAEMSEIEKENDALYEKLYYTSWFKDISEIDSTIEEGISEKLYTLFYKNTAGEIEARDVSMDDRIAEFKKRIATIFNLGAVVLKTDVKKIQIRGDKFTAQKNIYGDKYNLEGEQSAKISSLYDLADILATSKYDADATAKEPSYANTSVKPKNDAHKGVKYWYKFRNEIVFDGVPYTVTFNIRDKGGEQYQYLIEFKENKTPGLSNTVANNLLRTDQVSYDASIAPLGENIKRVGEVPLSNSTDIAPVRGYQVSGEDIAYQGEDIAPIAPVETEHRKKRKKVRK